MVKRFKEFIFESNKRKKRCGYKKMMENVSFSTKPKRETEVIPTETPTKPKSPPSPIRRERPSINPKPKALNKDDKKKLKTFDDVSERFIKILNKRGIDVKKYLKKYKK